MCCECELGLQVRYRDCEFPFMDVFVCDYYDKSTIKYCGFLSERGEPTWFADYYFPNEHVHVNELYPLKEIVFEDTKIMVPNIQKICYLERIRISVWLYVKFQNLLEYMKYVIKNHGSQIPHYKKDL